MLKHPEEIYFFTTFNGKSAFFRLKDVFPECFFYRESETEVEPLACLLPEGACPVGQRCMETLAGRVHVLFQETVPMADLLSYDRDWETHP